MKKSRLITRRTALITGITSLGGLILNGCSKPLPPTYGNILRMGDAFTYVAHRSLLPGQMLAKEYAYRDISSFPATGTTNPANVSKVNSEEYGQLRSGAFSDYRLSIEGKVARPGSYSLEDLQKFPSRKQITKHQCEEGWTAIAEWTGVQLSRVLEAVGVMPSARFVNFYPFDEFYFESIDMYDALHPQTILAYSMNGRDIPIQHGAPVRLRVENQIGYKSVKYLKRIVVTDKFVDVGDTGWSWYVGM